MVKKAKEIERPSMVSWLDLGQVRKTALEVGISTILGRHSDKRLFQSLATSGDDKGSCYYEVIGRDNQEFWFDYVADVGDGFNSTYSIAYHLAQDTLTLKENKKGAQEYGTQRGDLLIFGGDEVYPLATQQDYKDRLIGPYLAAFPEAKGNNLKDRPFACAIPGNHDWYDSLVEFSRLFRSERSFCGWNTFQGRSYFAVKLPRGWWMFATDMQLASSLDDPQVEYFKEVMKDVADDDRIILCNAEPYWITEKMYEKDKTYVNRGMGFFEGHVLEEKVAIYIAGDWHYYRHHEYDRTTKGTPPPDKSNRHKIVAGGGGAFLHPTHKAQVDEIGKNHVYKQKACFPNERTSFWLTFWNLGFVFWNWKFGVITGLLYLLTAQAFFAKLGAFEGGLSGQNTTQVITTFLSEPMAAVWVTITVVGFYFFADSHSRINRWVAGMLHGSAHLAAMLAIGLIVSQLFFHEPTQNTSIWRIVAAALVIFLTGGVVGSTIMGLYLLISLNLMGVHHNEAFTSIKIEDYKNFLRLRIDKNGDLTIFPVGIRRVTKGWTPYDSRKTPRIEPEEQSSQEKPFLIEEPFGYGKSYSSTRGDSMDLEIVKRPID